MGRVAGKVALVTGAGRGQGRSHAVRLAEEGADIIAVDVCHNIDTVEYDLSTEADLAETVELVEKFDRRAVSAAVDIRDLAALSAAVTSAVAQLGRLDIVCANAGIMSFGSATDLDEDAWQTVIDVNLSGAWRTCKAALPHIIAGGNGGSIIITSSTMGLKAYPNLTHYVAAKHGLVGLMKAMALELAPHHIRVNTIHPSSVNSGMVQNDVTYRAFRPDLESPGRDDVLAAFQQMNVIAVPWVEPSVISDTVVFLASDESRFTTGVSLPVDAGAMLI